MHRHLYQHNQSPCQLQGSRPRSRGRAPLQRQSLWLQRQQLSCQNLLIWPRCVGDSGAWVNICMFLLQHAEVYQQGKLHACQPAPELRRFMLVNWVYRWVFAHHTFACPSRACCGQCCLGMQPLLLGQYGQMQLLSWRPGKMSTLVCLSLQWCLQLSCHELEAKRCIRLMPAA